MPTFREARDAIADKFKAGFHAKRNEPIAFDNFAQLVDTNGDVVDKPGDAPWVRLSIRLASGDQVTLGRVGSRGFRHAGVVIVQIFVPQGRGDGTAYDIADAVADTLRGVTTQSVRFLAPDPPEFVGPDGGWWQVNVNTDVEFDLIA